MARVDILAELHTSTKRDYLKRVNDHDKAECAEVAVQFGKDYWDGERQFGYGGYRYDGRWRVVVERLVDRYKLTPDSRILDVGCGKGYLLYELTQVLPGCLVDGLDVSEYAVANAKPEVHDRLQVGHARDLPYEDNAFDLVISFNTLHNLPVDELFASIKEIERVSKGNGLIIVESFRNEREKVNLLYWQLTCRSFYDTREWEWIYDQAGYTGDFGFIFFE